MTKDRTDPWHRRNPYAGGRSKIAMDKETVRNAAEALDCGDVKCGRKLSPFANSHSSARYLPRITISATTMRWLLAYAALCAYALSMAHAWDQQPDGYELIDGPSPDEDVEMWRHQWSTWKQMELRTVRYDAGAPCTIYNVDSARWTQRNFLQGFVMLHDRDIFDRVRGVYTPHKYLNIMQRRVGGLDSVLLWPAYPNSGIDNRNQWDLMRTLPGGLGALQALIDVFHERGVRVILPYNPWDIATRDEFGYEQEVRMYTADVAMLAELVPRTHADGFNGDTMYGVPRVFYNCSTSSSSPLVAAPEGGVPSAYLSHNPMSWGYMNGYERFPPVARAKFLESRHMVQICARWSLDRMTELQIAFFNGAGYVVWENVWGIWNAMTAREDEATKRIFHVLRTWHAFTTSPSWRPYAYHTPGTDSENDVFISEFPLSVAMAEGDAGSGTGEVAAGSYWLYTIINVAGDYRTFRLPVGVEMEDIANMRAFDVFYGRELGVDVATDAANATSSRFVEVVIEPRGFSAVLVSKSGHTPPERVVSGFEEYMAARREMTSRPLASFSNARTLLRQHLVRESTHGDSSSFRSSATETATTTSSVTMAEITKELKDFKYAASMAVARDTPVPIGDGDDMNDVGEAGISSMVRITGASQWWFNVSGVQIEPVAAWTPSCAEFGTGVQFPWETRPWNNHSTRLLVPTFEMDRFPVSNAEFATFLQRSGYQPRSLVRFLAHWENRKQQHNTSATSTTVFTSVDTKEDKDTDAWNPVTKWRVPKELAQSPVIFVSVEDARAFATFHGKRLPHDWEWQYAASNGERYDLFPWGGQTYEEDRVHTISREKNPPLPGAVGHHPRSRSLKHGIHDLVGMVWQMTDQFCDDHTCGLLLRGGSFYQPVAATHSDPNWYFPQAYQSNQHNRFLMLSEGYDRSQFVGFRCVRSVENENRNPPTP